MDFLSVKKNAYFLRTPSLAYLIIPVCQILYNLREYVRVMKDIVTDFSLPCMHEKVQRTFSCCVSARRIYIMSCAGLDCLRRCFCVEFQARTCNIIYKCAVPRDTRKGCRNVFLTRSIPRRLYNGCQTETLSKRRGSRK